MTSFFLLTTLDRYIFKQIIDAFLLGVVIFTLVVFFSSAFLEFLRDVQRVGIPFDIILLLIGLQLPKSIALILPASAFLAVIMVYNDLNNKFELIAMRMNGISLRRLMAPALVLGLLATVSAYALSDYVVPYCNQMADSLEDEMLSRGTLPFGNRSFTYPQYDEDHNLEKLIFVSKYKGRKLDASTIIDLTDDKVMQIIQAKSGIWHPNHWEFRNASVYSIYKDRDLLAFNHSRLFKVPNLLKKDWKKPDADKKDEKDKKRDEKSDKLNLDSGVQNFNTLFSRIRTREHIGKRVTNGTYINMWEKLTLPFSCFVLILAAVPLAITPPRTSANRGFLFSIAILFLFYLLRSVFVAGAEVFTLGGLIPTPTALMFACWLPLVAVGVLGLWLLAKKSKTL